MNIKILGTGCPKCVKLEEITKKAVAELNVNAVLEKVQDLNKIMEYGVMMTPGLVINGQIKIAGKIPSIDQVKTWIQEAN